jgi:hypothetical protein
MSILADLQALDQLDRFLRDRGYNRQRIQRIRNDAWLTGELATSVANGDLASHHEQEATEVLVNAIPDVPADSPAWDDATIYGTTDDALIGTDYRVAPLSQISDDELSMLAAGVAIG